MEIIGIFGFPVKVFLILFPDSVANGHLYAYLLDEW